MTKEYSYLAGWGGAWQSEALPHALPEGQNSPQKAPYGLYAEQLSGSAFTRARHQNLRSWLYRIRPSVVHSEFIPLNHEGLAITSEQYAIPTQMRWDPLAAPQEKMNFVQSLKTLLHNGSPEQQCGAAVHLYAANTSMDDTFFYNSDGELLLVPYQGDCELFTEFGKIALGPGEIAVIPRGVRFQVKLLSPLIQGYICENYGQPFTLPDLGPIGSNGLANPRDFLIPTACFEERNDDFILITKFNNRLWQASLSFSPLNVVAWHGNYAPYKYDLKHFNSINTVSFDHCDPSIFTVLTSPSAIHGVANVDFVIFPERWMVAEHTFRPPYYHRNIMSEYMGLIQGVYDAKTDGFVPGGGSLHNCMSAHGPDALTAESAMNQILTPLKQANTLAFMFETCLPWIPTSFALNSHILQKNYQDCWKDIPSNFDRNWRP
ncbi:MAG: homogentisate 1,2-dioxygenase [Gammaproteobacteria bacterium 39-13]|nr:homogentisate 1,2-dioxygenase [Gammaproteobacteria bacterium]OJV86210.1 MAG: homogentisate 1,2-dioxygenase [Gammaproteobacteria bacterium 39-13]